MKADIHPKYYESKVHCGSCGREWTVGPGVHFPLHGDISTKRIHN